MITNNIGIVKLKISNELSFLRYSDNHHSYILRISFLPNSSKYFSILYKVYLLGENKKEATNNENKLFKRRNTQFNYGDEVVVMFDTDTNDIIAISNSAENGVWYDVNDYLKIKPFNQLGIDVHDISVFI